MSIGTIRSLRILHGAFGRYAVGDRVHLLGRFFTCPFLPTLDDVPENARVLDIGSGHGLFARLIVEERARNVVAVDPDIGKSVLPSPSPKIAKVAGFDECIRGCAFDAAVMYDVLYRIPIEQQRALLGRVFDRLRPGGVVILKDMDPTHRWKMKWARLQEWLADTFLHLTAGSGFYHQSPEDVGAMLTALGFEEFTARAIDRGYPHPHILYVARKPV